jgi:3-phosphoshikimate 1-carboxyvinyltransferase
MNVIELVPAVRLEGEASLPGDKSISHRLAMIGGMAEGQTIIQNFAASADCQSTLRCLEELGVPIRREGSTVTIQGCGMRGLREPFRELDAENSGTTVRLLSGILAAAPFESTFIGDASLSRRPMRRIMEPLRLFGARLEARDDNFLPLRISGGPLTAIDYKLPVASAQVKSAVLLAGSQARGITRVHEAISSRNHTEIALKQCGARIHSTDGTVEIEGSVPLHGGVFSVPGDLSSAAFLIAAALGIPGSRITLHRVGLNPTRSGFLTLLQNVGARIFVSGVSSEGGEAVGNLTVESSELQGFDIGAAWVPNVIDEIPVLAVLGTRTTNGIRIRDAAELRTKESDRIHSVAVNLRALGARVEETHDGLFVPGNQVLKGGYVQTFGDHRIAMAFAVAACFSVDSVTIDDASCAAVSFPGFFELLGGLVSS